jgi:hypothetical protein
MGSGVPCAACSATHWSSSRTTRRMSRPVISEAIPAISSNVTAALAVSVTGPLARKHLDADSDPVESLRAGWELHVGFGLANPELFRLMHTALRTPQSRAAAATGAGVLQARVHRVAEAGRLRVTERRAVELIQAAGTGVVFTLIDQAEDERDDTLADTAWESVCAAILVGHPAAAITGPAAAAVTLHATLPDLTALTPAERALLGDWLDRIAESQREGAGRLYRDAGREVSRHGVWWPCRRVEL